MSEYPGERELYDAGVVSGSYDGWTLYQACYPGYFGTPRFTSEDTVGVDMSSGDDVWFYGAAYTLQATDEIGQVNWIVELEQGGTFIPSTSYDLGYAYDFSALTWTAGSAVSLGPGRHAFSVPMDQRTYEKLTDKIGLPAFRLQVTAGSPKLTGCYMQTEGPGGLKKQIGTTPGEWIDSPLRTVSAKATLVTETRAVEIAAPGAPGDDVTALVESAFTQALTAEPMVTTYENVSTRFPGAVAEIYLRTFSTNLGTQNNAGCTISTGYGTVHWPASGSVVPDFSMTSLTSLRYGRDLVGFEFDTSQQTHPVSWLPTMKMLPMMLYDDVYHDDVQTSPQDDTYVFSYYGTISGDQAPLNQLGLSTYLNNLGLASGVTTPSPGPGDIELTCVNPWEVDREIVPPVGGWVPDGGDGWAAVVGFHAVAAAYLIDPKVQVFIPRARAIIPVWGQSELSIGGSGGGGPIDPGVPTQVWGDWFIPGWGDWSWFPDYSQWSENYPYNPVTDYNDYYIPLPTLPTYHYLPFDLNTNTQLGEIPLEDVTYSHKLSAPGSANFSIPVTPEMLKQQIKQSSVPGKTGLYIIRDNQIVWGGIIWKRQYDSGNRQVRFEAGSFESYFNHRFQSNVLGFEDVDQMTIARTLALQAADEMHIDVDPATSGVNRYYNAFYYDFKTIGGEIDSLASLWDGFDWNIRVYLDNTGVVRRRLVWGYPQLGVQAADTPLIFEYPGSIRSYTVTEDADQAGNRVWAIGGGQGLDQIQYEARDDVQLAAGWPLLETTTSYKDVFQPARLQARSKQDLERLRPPVTVLNVEVDPFSFPKLGTYNPGDWARFVIQDNWNNPGIDIKRRIVGYTVNVSATSPLDRVTLDIDAGDTT